ncbi:hypothetical protein N9F00_02950 [Planktomarina temperata]|nr:hypothetical protein [Planktomarina temperata]
MEEAKSKPVKASKADNLNLSWRDARYHRFYEVVDQLVDELQKHVWVKTGKAKRRVKGDGLEKLHYSVECLVRDCVAVVLQRKRKSEAAIRKGQYYYSSERPDQMLTYSIHIERAFEGLVELGYLEITKPGYFDRNGRKDGTPTSRLSRYIASDRLLGLFTAKELKALAAIIPSYCDPELLRIRVKEKDDNGVKRKRSIAVTETAETIRMCKNLNLINKALSMHWYDLEIPDDELSALQKRLADNPQNERIIRMDQRFLHRVFNDPDLQTGGRFYGGWWQNIPREYRQHLAVNGKRMVELDYSNQHPSILYAQASIVRPADCYSGVIKPPLIPDGVTAKDLRDMVKAAFNAMLNSPKPLRQAPKGVKPSKFGLKWAEVSEAIIAFHEPIAHHFYTGVGLRLQRLDSDIAEKVLLHFARSGIAVLPLHDSFLMHNGYEPSLDPVMRSAFEEVVGASPKIDRKEPDKVLLQDAADEDDPFGPVTTDDLDELLADLDVGCEHRLRAFRALQRA